MVINIFLKNVDSTQIYAKAHFAEFQKGAITCVSAEEQTAGRGRFQRKWLSPAGVNLYVTFCFALPLRTPDLSCLAQIMTYTLATLLKESSPQLKWPNDVQLRGKKLSGALCETAFIPEEIQCFLGIGVNVNMSREALDAIDQPATSLLVETGRTWDRKALLKELQTAWEKNFALFKREGFAPFHKPIEELLAYKGKEVRGFDGHRKWHGICHSLAPDGRLNVYDPVSKTMQVISAGEIAS